MPGNRGVPLALEQEAGRLIAREQGFERMRAEILDQRPAELAGDEIVLEVDGAGLLPGARPLRPGPVEEDAVQLERRSDVEARHDLLGMERRVPERRAAAHRGAHEEEPLLPVGAQEAMDAPDVLQIPRHGDRTDGAAGEPMALEVERAEAEARRERLPTEELRFLTRLLGAEAMEVENAGPAGLATRIEAHGEVGHLAAVLDDGDSLHQLGLDCDTSGGERQEVLSSGAILRRQALFRGGKTMGYGGRREIAGWHSPILGQQMPIVSYGHWGHPLLLFPTAAADFLENERFLLIDAVEGALDAGRVRVFSINSINQQAWMDSSLPVPEQARRQALYARYVEEEVVPYIRHVCQSPDLRVATCGASFGAFHAANTLFRRPDLFDAAIAMSGFYDLGPD